MTPEQIKNRELDKLVFNILKSNDKMIIPTGLSEKTIRKLEKIVILRNLMLELVLKFLLVSGSIFILTGVFIWINGSNFLTVLYSHFAANWQIISLLLFVGIVTILIDQIGLRFYEAFRKGHI